MRKLVLLSMVISIISGTALANRFSDMFRSKGESEQLGIMNSVIRSSGYQCSSAYELRFYGSQQDNDFWIVYCSDGYYVVAFYPDGSTKVLDCKMSQILGIDCFE
jgi:hypothetical protein